MEPTSESKLYTQRFFASQQEGSRRSAEKIAPIIMQLLAPKSVLDVGCGVGTWLTAFAACGVADYLGVDGEYVDHATLVIPQDRFQSRDLKEPLNLGRTFDLVCSLEVAEHLPPARALAFVQSLTRHAPAALFSAAIPQQGGTGHLNERWQSFWAAQFAQCGFDAIDCIRRRVWHDHEVEPWYAQNTLLYVRRDALEKTPALVRERDEASAAMPLDVVHPGVLINSLANQDFNVRAELAQPTREQRILATKVPMWLEAISREPNDAKSRDALKRTRGELAILFAESAPLHLPTIFGGPMGTTYRQLLRSAQRYEALGAEERTFVESRFPGRPIDWSSPSDAGRFLATSLYRLPHHFEVKFNYQATPHWLRDDVVAYLAQPVTQFTGAADADAYANFVKRAFGEIEPFLRDEPSAELKIRVGAAISDQPHQTVLALSTSSDAREAEQLRARIVEHTRRALGYQL